MSVRTQQHTFPETKVWHRSLSKQAQSIWWPTPQQSCFQNLFLLDNRPSNFSVSSFFYVALSSVQNWRKRHLKVDLQWWYSRRLPWSSPLLYVYECHFCIPCTWYLPKWCDEIKVMYNFYLANPNSPGYCIRSDRTSPVLRGRRRSQPQKATEIIQVIPATQQICLRKRHSHSQLFFRDFEMNYWYAFNFSKQASHRKAESMSTVCPLSFAVPTKTTVGFMHINVETILQNGTTIVPICSLL